MKNAQCDVCACGNGIRNNDPLNPTRTSDCQSKINYAASLSAKAMGTPCNGPCIYNGKTGGYGSSSNPAAVQISSNASGQQVLQNSDQMNKNTISNISKKESSAVSNLNNALEEQQSLPQNSNGAYSSIAKSDKPNTDGLDDNLAYSNDSAIQSSKNNNKSNNSNIISGDPTFENPQKNIALNTANSSAKDMTNDLLPPTTNDDNITNGSNPAKNYNNNSDPNYYDSPSYLKSLAANLDDNDKIPDWSNNQQSLLGISANGQNSSTPNSNATNTNNGTFDSKSEDQNGILSNNDKNVIASPVENAIDKVEDKFIDNSGLNDNTKENLYGVKVIRNDIKEIVGKSFDYMKGEITLDQLNATKDKLISDINNTAINAVVPGYTKVYNYLDDKVKTVKQVSSNIERMLGFSNTDDN